MNIVLSLLIAVFLGGAYLIHVIQNTDGPFSVFAALATVFSWGLEQRFLKPLKPVFAYGNKLLECHKCLAPYIYIPLLLILDMPPRDAIVGGFVLSAVYIGVVGVWDTILRWNSKRGAEARQADALALHYHIQNSLTLDQHGDNPYWGTMYLQQTAPLIAQTAAMAQMALDNNPIDTSEENGSRTTRKRRKVRS